MEGFWKINFYSRQIRMFRFGVYLVLLFQIFLLWPVREIVLEANLEILNTISPIANLLGYLSVTSFLIFHAIFLLLGLISHRVFFRVVILANTLFLHAHMTKINDAGDSLLGIWCILLVLMSESNKNAGISNLAVLVARYQLCLVYALAGLGKLLSKPWLFGHALIYVFQNPGLSSSLGTAMLSMPLFLVLGNYLTIFFQISFPFLIWNKKVAPFMIFVGTIIHLQISFLMGLLTFGLAMAVSYSLFHRREVVIG